MAPCGYGSPGDQVGIWGPPKARPRVYPSHPTLVMGSKSPLAIGPILLSGLLGRNSPNRNLPTTIKPVANDASITIIQLSDSVNFRVPKCLFQSTSSFLKTYSPFKTPLNVQRRLVHDQDFSSVVSSCLELVTGLLGFCLTPSVTKQEKHSVRTWHNRSIPFDTRRKHRKSSAYDSKVFTQAP